LMELILARCGGEMGGRGINDGADSGAVCGEIGGRGTTDGTDNEAEGDGRPDVETGRDTGNVTHRVE